MSHLNPLPHNFLELSFNDMLEVFDAVEDQGALIDSQRDRATTRLNEEYGRTVVTEANIDDAFNAFLTSNPALVRGQVIAFQRANNLPLLADKVQPTPAQIESARAQIITLSQFQSTVPSDTRTSIERFDTVDTVDLIDQIKQPYSEFDGTVQGNLVELLTTIILLDNETRGIGDLSSVNETLVANNPELGQLVSSIEFSEIDIDEHAETAGLERLKISQALDVMVEKGFWTQAEANAVRGREGLAGVPLTGGQRLEVARKWDVLVQNIRSPELNQEINSRRGSYQEAFTAVLDSPEEFNKLRRGEDTLISVPSQLADQQIAAAEASELAELAIEADTDALVEEIMDRANITTETDAEKAVKKQIERDVKDNAKGRSPEQLVELIEDRLASYESDLASQIRQDAIEEVSTESGANKARNEFFFQKGISADNFTAERLADISRAVQGFGGATPEFEQFFAQSAPTFQQEKINQDFQKLSPEKRQATALGQAGFPQFDEISPRGQVGAFGNVRARAFQSEARRVGAELSDEVLRAIEEDPTSDALGQVRQFSSSEINLLGQRFGTRGPGFDPVTRISDELTSKGFRLEHLRETGQIQDGPPSPSFFAPERPNRLDRGLEEEIARLSEGAPEGFSDFLRAQVPTFRTEAGEITRSGNRREEEFDIRFEPRRINGQDNPAFTGRISRTSRGKTTPTFQATTRVSSLLRRDRASLLSRFQSESETPEERRRSLRSFGGSSRIRGIIGRV